MATLLDLPTSVLEDVLLGLQNLRDVSSLAQTCRFLRRLIYFPSDARDFTNTCLWRQLFLMRYDDPRASYLIREHAGLLDGSDARAEDRWIDWMTLLQSRRAAVSRIARSAALRDAVSFEPLETELRHFIDALQTATPGPGPSSNVEMVTAAALAQRTLTFSGRPAASLSSFPAEPLLRPFDQLICQLSTYFGTERPDFPESHRQGARARVYMLNSWRKNQWSPFNAKTNEVEWDRVEMLALVACYNATDVITSMPGGGGRLPPCRLANARPYTAPGWDDFSIKHDWAGVTGVWARCINFVDWHALFAFQTALARGSLETPADFFARYRRPEAVHVHSWRFSIVDTEPDPDRPRFPKLHFKAQMVDQGIYMHSPSLRGLVSLAADGNVRFDTITNFEGVDAYSSSGIQVGGIRSAYGVVGLWSGVHHEPGDPAGPVYMWKIADEDF